MATPVIAKGQRIIVTETTTNVCRLATKGGWPPPIHLDILV